MALSHVMIGVGAYGAVAVSTGGVHSIEPLAIVAAVAGSLAPDIDHPSSWLGRRLLFISIPISALFGHRGFTHSLLATLAAAAYLWFAFDVGAQSDWLGAFALGYLLHLFADWNSNSGVPFFWPLGRRYRAPWAIQTGGVVETALVGALGGFLIWQGYQLLL